MRDARVLLLLVPLRLCGTHFSPCAYIVIERLNLAGKRQSQPAVETLSQIERRDSR